MSNSEMSPFGVSTRLHPHMIYFYDDQGRIQKKEKKRYKISNMYSTKMVKKMLNRQKPKMFKT